MKFSEDTYMDVVSEKVIGNRFSIECLRFIFKSYRKHYIQIKLNFCKIFKKVIVFSKKLYDN